jgi:plasmid stability protein
MANLKVRRLHENIARALKTRAARRGVSLEEEIRSTLSASVILRRRAFSRRAAALRASTAGRRAAALDSARIIRKERNATG